MHSYLSSEAGELKQQGAADAARDPNNNTTSLDAEKVMVEESRKAGVPAFQFDANASPEEKAAQAHLAQPQGLRHERTPKGVGIATDIDDGTPGEYDLPPPTTEGALAAVPSDIDGVYSHTNGHVPEDENARWVERAGWAPRFGNGSIAGSEEHQSQLDHQTWVESRLDDKFFGDWYHNTAVIIFACLSSYVVALVGGGLAWIFIIMAVCGTYYRTSIRRVRRNFRDDVNREMAKARLETDHESLEWMNSFLVKFWPIYAPVLAETVINSVDQVLSTSTPAFLDSMRMKSFTLGTKPPRMDHVKTYPKADDDIVLMDWKFSFTPNDKLDMTARQIKNKVNPKIVLEIRVGKALISKGLDVILEDMAFSGLMRVKVKLQIPFPHVEKIEICFLERPTIDYVLKPLGGDHFGFDINFIPGLEGFIMEQIHANLGPIMYDPNVFPIEVAKMLSGNPVDQAIGVLAVTIHGAQGLKNPDKFGGTPDPYVIVSLNSRVELGRTTIVKQNANPRWNKTLYMLIVSLTDSLTLQLFDFNDYRKDKELGMATFALDQIESAAEHENLQLEVMANGKPRGIVQADVRFFPVLEGRKLEDGKTERPPESNTGIARFTVEQAKELDGTKSLIGALNPYAVILLNNKEMHVTQKLKRTNNPIWPNGSKEFLITDRKAAKVAVVIKDDRELGGDVNLGMYQIKIDDMIQMMDKGQEWYSLANAKSGRVKLTLQWKPVGLKGELGGSGGYITPIGVMRLHFKNARELRNVETMGKSDPYVRVLLSGIEKGRTVTFQNDLNPDWDEVIYVPMHSTREKLTLEVMDAENVGRDRSLGLVELAAADYITQAENGEYLVNDDKRPISSPLRMSKGGSPKGILNFAASFYPTLNIADPEEEEEERKALEKSEKLNEETGRNSSDTRKSLESQKSFEKDPIQRQNDRDRQAGKIDTRLASQLVDGEKNQEETTVEDKPLPKIHLTTEELVKYESGLIVFNLIEAELSHPNVHVEVVMDDMLFPSYSSSKARSRQVKFGEIGDAFVREMDFSKITLRLTEKTDKKGDDRPDNTVARLSGNTLDTLRQCLYKPTILTLKDTESGGSSRVTVSLKYLPVKMQLDASESIHNQGNLRVDVLDAADLPSMDRNGFSDPYCKFELNEKEVYKTKVQKKTLHPSWNEYFEIPVKSRTAARFKVKAFDWDFGDKADFLGAADINLEILEPFQSQEVLYTLDGKSGRIRLRFLFKSAYVTRSRQGSSTFSGTFATPGKIVGAPVKGVGMLGGGVIKGASFIRHGFKGRKKTEEDNGFVEAEENTNGDSLDRTPSRAVPIIAEPTSPSPPAPLNQRSPSFGGQSRVSVSGGRPAGAESGTAQFTVVAATGYPPNAHVRVHVRQVSSKGAKDVHKTKAIKAPSGQVQWEHESFKVNCTADTQFQLQVRDHATFGSGDDLGEGLFFVDDSASGGEKAVKAGAGSVVLRSSFTATNTDGASPRSATRSRMSFLGKMDPRDRGERGSTLT